MTHLNFRCSGLRRDDFSDLFGASEQSLAQHGVRRIKVDANPGYPCRISLSDAPVGTTVYALSYNHHASAGPYAATGPIFVRADAAEARLARNEIPDFLRGRQLSLRAYTGERLLQRAMVVDGAGVDGAVRELLTDPAIEDIHVHNAAPGCYMCVVARD